MLRIPLPLGLAYFLLTKKASYFYEALILLASCLGAVSSILPVNGCVLALLL